MTIVSQYIAVHRTVAPLYHDRYRIRLWDLDPWFESQL